MSKKLPNYLTDPTPEQAELAREAGAGVAYSGWPEGTISGRWSSNKPNMTEQKKLDQDPGVHPQHGVTARIRRTKLVFWPLAYITGPRKLSEGLAERPSAEDTKALMNMDYSALEARVAAWHADSMKQGGDSSTKEKDDPNA